MSRKKMENKVDPKCVKRQSDQKSGQSNTIGNPYSMLDFEWKDQYNIGIPEIDYQHRYFLKLIKRITGVVIEKKEPDYGQRVLMELVYYAKFHFYSEENMMIYHGYPNLRAHQELHRDLIDLLTNKINAISDNVDEYHLLVQFLLQWFVHHSMEEDKKIASCLK